MRIGATAVKPASVASLGAILLVLVLGIGYLSFGVLGQDPFREQLTAHLLVRNSGGLGTNSPVMLTGIRVGKVTKVARTAAGVQVDFQVEGTHRIPVSSSVVIENLSALGEPYLEFKPQRDQGPYVHDGQQLDARADRAPILIPQLSVRVVDFIGQLDPKTIANLVGTLDTALKGTEGEVPRLERSTRLLAATILSRTAELRQLSADLQATGSDMAWTGPALATSGPTWGEFGASLDSLINTAATVFEVGDAPGDYLHGDGLVPFLRQLAALLNRIGPQMSELAPVLAPMAGQLDGALGRLDISALLTQALATVGDDGAIHLRIDVK